MTSQNLIDFAEYHADLELDFANEDQTGYLWTWLDSAHDPDQIVPGAVLILRDGEDVAMGQVVDLVSADGGTIVHLDLLPGAIEDYRAAIERATTGSGGSAFR